MNRWRPIVGGLSLNLAFGSLDAFVGAAGLALVAVAVLAKARALHSRRTGLVDADPHPAIAIQRG